MLRIRQMRRSAAAPLVFEMGTRQPFVVWWQQEPGSGERVREVLGAGAYSVLEFDG